MEYKRNLRLGVEGYTDDELSLDVYGNVNVSGNISVAGTVTYDDVTNIDAIGLVTARSGIDIGYPGTATTLTADGNAVFSGIVTAAQFFGDGSGLDGVTGVSIVAQEATGDPVYPTFASNVGVTTLGIAQTGFVYVPSTGSVGVGTTNPKTKLEINGVLGFSTFTGFSNTQTTNIRIGDNTTGANITGIGQDNIFIGVGAGNSTTTGYWNTYIGRDAGRSNINGINNVFIGDKAGKISVGGGDNVFIGKEAGANTTNNSSDIFIGKFAGKNSGETYDNVFLGSYAGMYNTGNRNQFIGQNAGSNNTGWFNVVIGDGAGYVNEGWQSVFVGPFAGGDNTTGSYNNFFGNGSGSSNTTGSNNNFFGSYSAYSNTVGSYNNFFGSDSGSSNTTGIYNIYLGSFNGSTTVSSRKVIIGSGNAYNQLFDAPDTTKDTQLAIGIRTDANDSKYWLVGNENFNVGIGTTNPQTKLEVGGVLGFGAGNNVRIGDNTTGANLTTGYNNIFIGVGAGKSTTSGYNNNFFGDSAGYYNTFGDYNNFFGRYAGKFNSGGKSNNFFGRRAGYGNTTGKYNNFFGQFAGYNNQTGSDNNFFGQSAGYSNQIGYDNNFVGSFAGWKNTGGYLNNFFGTSAGQFNLTGNYNNFFGSDAGRNNTTASYNSFFGESSGFNNTTGSRNAIFGDYSGYGNTIGNNNTFTGSASGRSNKTGNNNIFLGANSGISTSASYKVILGSSYQYGTYFDAPDTTKDIQFAVGIRTDANPSKYWLVGNENFNVGIGTTNPTSKLTVGGDISNNHTTYGSVTSSTTTLSPVGIHSALPVATYRSVEYFIQATTGSRYHAVKLLSIHDGSTAYNTTYGDVFSNGPIANFDVDISGGNVRLVSTASTDANVSYIVNYTANRI